MSSDQGTHAGSNEFNKIAGAVLGTLLFTMAIGIASNAIFTVATPAKPGYDLPSAAAAAAAPAPAAKAVPIAQLLAKADPKKGEALSVVCKACHNVAKGGTAMVGPPLWDVVNRKMGAVAGFPYSDGLAKKGENWTFDNLNLWLEAPATYVPGTKMGYAGEKNDQKRADLIAYLATLADTPVPMPKP